MSNTDPRVLKDINSLAARRLQLEVAKDDATRKFKDAVAVLESVHSNKLAGYEAEIKVVDAQIWQQANDNRSSLIARGKQSFVTMVAKFQFRKTPSKTKVSDAAGVMDAARRLGVVKQIAEPPKGGWKLNPKKFLVWLDGNGEYRPLFEAFIDVSEDSETLHLQPNTNYTVDHDSKRVSPPSVSIEKS